MIDERLEELASLHVLDLLEGKERAQFEAALARDAELQRLVRGLRDTTAALAHTAAAAVPPSPLKARVLASIDESKAAPDNIVRLPGLGLWQILPWAAAACLAFGLAWLGQLYVASRAETSTLRDREALAQIALKGTQQQLEAQQIIAQHQLQSLDQQLTNARQLVTDREKQIASLTAEMKTQGDLANLKIAALSSLLDNSPQARAVAVWDPAKQEGVFALEEMPAIAPNQKLELWVVEAKPGAKPISAGVLNLENKNTRVRFKPTAAVTAIAAFAISREKNDGATSHAAPAEVIMLGHTR